MGRLTDALLVLLGRCAPEGTKPEGNNVDDVIRCLSEHSDGGRLLITVTDTGNGYKSDKTYAEILAAYNSGKDLVVNFHNSIFHLISTFPFSKSLGVLSLLLVILLLKFFFVYLNLG